MKQKIKEALKQQYGTRANKELGQLQLGLSDEVFERVAASVETFITDESAIEGWVKSEATKSMLQSYQSEADKARAKSKTVNEPTPQPSDNGNNPPEPKPETPDIAALIEAALDKKLNPITERLNTFESTRAKETAVAALDKLCAEWDYAQGFPKERDEAKRIALKIYKAGGEQMTGEQLIAAFREEFDPAVKGKGVTDFSKPFQSDGGAGGDPKEADAAFAAEIRRALGKEE
ncbi:hypothetical protein [Muribaculum intestinale]|uniref:hypothetical protein n=1 Tax=Muribaculum intestinale TaxID=1796646 RepID=UPI0025B2A4D9|nr:hypothetical protein [Muribaculum intestinale]